MLNNAYTVNAILLKIPNFITLVNMHVHVSVQCDYLMTLNLYLEYCVYLIRSVDTFKIIFVIFHECHIGI